MRVCRGTSGEIAQCSERGPDGCGARKCERLSIAIFLILDQSSASARPCEGPFDQPSFRRDDEPLGPIRMSDDFDVLGRQYFLHCGAKHRALIAAIGVELQQKWLDEALATCSQLQPNPTAPAALVRRRSVPRQGGRTRQGRQATRSGAIHAPSRVPKSPLGKRFFGPPMNRSMVKSPRISCLPIDRPTHLSTTIRRRTEFRPLSAPCSRATRDQANKVTAMRITRFDKHQSPVLD